MYINRKAEILIPKYLKLQNFVSHEDSYIDFSTFNSALIVGMNNNNPNSSNGAGKSSIIDAVDWCLFEKSRHKRVEDVIRHKANETRVEFCFTKDNKDYIIIRKRSRDGAHDVFIIENSNDISASTASITTEKIQKLVDFDHEMFINSAFLRKNDITKFALATPREKKDLIKSILNIKRWDFYEETSKDHLKKFKSSLEDYQKKYNVEDIKNNIKRISKNIKSEKDKRRELYIETRRLRELLRNIDILSEEEKAKRIKELKVELKEKENNSKNYSKKLDSLKKEYVSLVSNLDYHKNKKEPEKLNFAESDIKNLINIRNKSNEELATLVGISEKLKNIESGKCFTCGTTISLEKAKEINNSVENERKAIKEKVINLKNDISKANKDIKNMEESLNLYNKSFINYTNSLDEISKTNILLKSNNESSVTTEELNSKNEEQVTNIKGQIKELEKVTEITLLDSKNELIKLEKEIESLNINIGTLTEKRNNKILEYKDYIKDEVTIKELNKKTVIYDQLRQIFGKKGIQSILLAKVSKELEIRTNAILKLICENDKQMSISVDLQRVGSNNSILETFDINVIIGSFIGNFESLSDGEQIRVAFAMRIGLSEILSSKRNNNIGFLLLDELDGSLDDIGASSFINVVKELEKRFKVLVITHKKDIKDSFENKILVKNDFGVSSVYQNI